MTTHQGHTSRPPLDVPESNRTALGLYVTPEEAYRKSHGRPGARPHPRRPDLRGVHLRRPRGDGEEHPSRVPQVRPGRSLHVRPAARVLRGAQRRFRRQGEGGVRPRRHDPGDVRDRGRGAMAEPLAQAGQRLQHRQRPGGDVDDPGVSVTASTCGTAGRTPGCRGATTSTRTSCGSLGTCIAAHAPERTRSEDALGDPPGHHPGRDARVRGRQHGRHGPRPDRRADRRSRCATSGWSSRCSSSTSSSSRRPPSPRRGCSRWSPPPRPPSC